MVCRVSEITSQVKSSHGDAHYIIGHAATYYLLYVDMPVTVSSSDGELVHISREAVKQSGTLTDWLDDLLGEDEEDLGAFPVHLCTAKTLRAAVEICEQAATGKPAPARTLCNLDLIRQETGHLDLSRLTLLSLIHI